MIQVQLAKPADPATAIEVDAYLDSGAGKSLFDGQIARAIGLDLNKGRPQSYSSTAGYSVNARLHQAIISHPDLGQHSLEVGFSDQEIRRNLLGRDFFALMQIGFREMLFTFYVTASP
jgi:hypothetical protein